MQAPEIEDYDYIIPIRLLGQPVKRCNPDGTPWNGTPSYDSSKNYSKAEFKKLWPSGRYTDLEVDIFMYQNAIRKDPTIAQKDLEERAAWFIEESNSYKKPGCGTIETEEGKAAVDEAIEFVTNQQPVDELHISNHDLIQQCRHHGDWCSSIGGISFDSPVLGDTTERIRRAVPKSG